MNEWQPVVTLLAGIPIALFTSWLTVKWALRRFQSEKWFEKRIEAYTKVIESLHYMKHCNELEFRAEQKGYEIGEAKQAELVTSYRKGLADLRRLTDMGALFFSTNAVTLLDSLNNELSSAAAEPSRFECLDAKGAAIDKCLSSFRVVAIKDLNAKR